MHQSKLTNHHQPSVSDFLQPSTGASSQPQQTPIPSSLISLQSLSETRNGSYTIMSNKRKNAQTSPLRSTTPVKPLSMITAANLQSLKSPQQFTESQISQIIQPTFISPTGNPFMCDDRSTKKTPTYMSKSALRGSTNAYSPRPSGSDLSPLGTSQSFIRKSNDTSIYMKTEPNKTPTKGKKAKRSQDNSNKLYILGNKLENLIQKLQKYKNECVIQIKPPQADKVVNGTMPKKSPNKSTRTLVSSRGNLSSCEDLDDNNFMKILQNCEADWRLFKEDLKKVRSTQKSKADGLESDRRRDDSLEQMLMLNTSGDTSNKEFFESDYRNFADDMKRFREGFKAEKAKVMKAVAKQEKETEKVEENMDTFLKKVMKFSEGFSTKVDYINKCVDTLGEVDMPKKELDGLLSGEMSPGKKSISKVDRSKSRNREIVPNATIDLEQVKSLSPVQKKIKSPINKRKEREGDENRGTSHEKNEEKSVKKELESVKRELQRVKDENFQMYRVLEVLQNERNDVKDQLQRANKKDNESSSQDRCGDTTPVGKRKNYKGAVSYRKTLESTDSIKKEKSKLFGTFSARKDDSIRVLGRELRREQMSINRQVGECQTARGENQSRGTMLDGDTRSPGSARGNIQTLLEKLNLLSDDYEAYKGQKEQNLRNIQDFKEEEYGRLVKILHERESSIQNLREENMQLRSEAGKMAKQLGLYCWSPRELANIQKQMIKNVGSQKTLAEGSLNYSYNVVDKTRSEAEGANKKQRDAEGSVKKGKSAQGHGKNEDELEGFKNNFGITRREVKNAEQMKKEAEEIKKENTLQMTSKENGGIKRGLIEKIAMMGREGTLVKPNQGSNGGMKKEYGKLRPKGESFLKI